MRTRRGANHQALREEVRGGLRGDRRSALPTKDLGDESTGRGSNLGKKPVYNLLLVRDRVPNRGHVDDDVGRHAILRVNGRLEGIGRNLVVIETEEVAHALSSGVRNLFLDEAVVRGENSKVEGTRGAR